MIKSMTGFGKSTFEWKSKKIIIEIKSLNSKILDINSKIANGYRAREIEIRSEVGKTLERGKIDISVSIEYKGDTSPYTINRNLVKKYYNELKNLSAELNEKEENLFSLILKMPDVLVAERDELDEDEWKLFRKGLLTALSQTEEFRTQEGNMLMHDFVNRIYLILSYLNAIETFEKERIVNLKERFRKSFAELKEEIKIDENRFEQELIYYIEKIDITEEKIRLKNHCDYFIITLQEAVSQGKKLSFITQEIGREINTIGSKANEVNIQKLVVQMKDELEKIKEQLGNIL
ncbi:MAG: YicC family protein [Lentimicrobiaceae bacterium]|nr:YicC family protein [Lentimicrobiaceae bacterium]